MGSLELEIPPLIFVVIFAVTILLMELAVALAGVFSFNESDTAVNQTTPQKAIVLVTSGVYKFKRNPIGSMTSKGN